MTHELLMALGGGAVEWHEAAAAQGIYITSWGPVTTIIDYTTPDDGLSHDYAISFHGGGDSAYYCADFQIGLYIGGNFQGYLTFGGSDHGTICNGVWSDWYSDALTVTVDPNTQILLYYESISSPLSLIANARVVQQ